MKSLEKAGLATAVAAAGILVAGVVFAARSTRPVRAVASGISVGPVKVYRALKFDVANPLASLAAPATGRGAFRCASLACGTAPGDAAFEQAPAQAPLVSAAGAAVEQSSPGGDPPVPLADSFDGLGAGFSGPQGTGRFFRNPSDNSLAVGPDDIVQIVNSEFAVYSKKGDRYPETGKVLYGPVPTNAFFSGFGGPCEERTNGDSVVRYDQLAQRWLIVMPIFRPLPPPGAPAAHAAAPQPGIGGALATSGVSSVPGPPAAPPANPPSAFARPQGIYGVCYALSVGTDPLGPYYRYAFERTNFPDYPRPAVWPDGYYVATSSGDTVIQKQVCVINRAKMLKGEPATEQCVVIDGVNFLNNADIDGQGLPPEGAPNIMMAAGGTQLKKIFDSSVIDYWKVHVDWDTPSNTKLTGPVEIPVAPYHYLCDGQLTRCVPQPGTDVRLDAQGDKIMQRLVYRRIGDRQFIVVAHSVDTSAGGGGVRWYEFLLDDQGDPQLDQQGTYAPDGLFRWMPSIDMDRMGDIGVGYSYGGPGVFPGQRFAVRSADAPKGQFNFQETVLAAGEAPQTSGNRWEDYTTTAMDPSDDCTFWYVGDYLKKDATDYSTRIGAFRVPGCGDQK